MDGAASWWPQSHSRESVVQTGSTSWSGLGSRRRRNCWGSCRTDWTHRGNSWSRPTFYSDGSTFDPTHPILHDCLELKLYKFNATMRIHWKIHTTEILTCAFCSPWYTATCLTPSRVWVLAETFTPFPCKILAWATKWLAAGNIGHWCFMGTCEVVRNYGWGTLQLSSGRLVIIAFVTSVVFYTTCFWNTRLKSDRCVLTDKLLLSYVRFCV